MAGEPRSHGGRGGAVVFFFIWLSGGWLSICQAPGSHRAALGKMDEDEEGWMRSEEFICPVILQAVLQLPETLCQLLLDCFLSFQCEYWLPWGSNLTLTHWDTVYRN